MLDVEMPQANLFTHTAIIGKKEKKRYGNNSIHALLPNVFFNIMVFIDGPIRRRANQNNLFAFPLSLRTKPCGRKKTIWLFTMKRSFPFAVKKIK